MTETTMDRQALGRLSVPELRERLKDLPGAGGMLRSFADRALALSLLTRETVPTDWILCPQADGSATWRRAAGQGQEAPAPVARETGPADVLADAIRALAAGDLETRLASLEQRLREHGGGASRIRVDRWDGTTQTLDEHAHAALPELTRRVTQRGQRNVLLWGPAGSGKSTLAAQLARVLEVPYGFLSLSGDVTASHLIGLCPIKLTDGTVHHVPSPLTAMWEAPGVVCLDEIDRADPGTSCALNAALAQGTISIPQVNKTLVRHPQLVVIGCGNTPMQGSDGTYHAAQAQDAALADRFVASMRVDYDRDLERALARGLADGKTATADAVCERVWHWRERAQATRFSVPVTTRWILALVPAACDGVAAADWLRYCASWIKDTDATRLEGN